MSTEVALPALGESVTEGTVSRWLKQVGDTVAVDEPLVEISTDKVDTEIPSPVAGTLIEIKVAEDETVEVGAVLGVIGSADDADSGDSGSDSADSADSADSTDSADSAEAEAPAAEPAQQATEQPADDPTPEPAQAEEAAEPEPGETEQTSEPTTEPETAPPADTKPSSGGGTEVSLPALGESVTEGTVSRWLKQVGDTVEVDEPLVEISTDKVDTEIPSPVSGTLSEIRVAEDETVEVGAVLAVIGGGTSSSADDDGAADQGADEQATPAEQAEEPSAEPEGEQPDSADEIAEQPAAGDEGGQAPIPTPTQDQPASETTSETTPEPEPEPEPTSESKPDSRPEPAKPRRASEPTASADISYVTPLVRKLAAQHGVDLESLAGTGVGGRIRKQDVLAAAEEASQAAQKAADEAAAAQKATDDAAAAPKPAAQSAPAAAAAPDASALRGTTEKITRLRATIARRMVESLQVSAQLTATVEVDLTKISRLRARVKTDFVQREGVKLSYLPFITKAVAETLKAYPKVNARIDTDAGTITYSEAENIGIAVDTEKGLIVPVIRDAGDLNIAGIAKKIADLAGRSRTNKLTPDDLAGGTFTITNYGSAGTLMDTPIINQPQVAILGTGALVKRPVVISDANLGDTIIIRDMMYISMSYDHRLVDGADAARFLSALKVRLEDADFESELGL